MQERMKQNTKERNYWPYAIIISIILMVIACAWTIKIALDNPVQMDSFYFDKYQQVDRNINEIMKKQKVFFDKFNIQYKEKKISVNKPFDLEFTIKDKKTHKNIKNASVSFLITRPETNDANQEFTLNKTNNGTYKVKNIVVAKPGRWQLLAKIKYKDFIGFHKYEVYASK